MATDFGRPMKPFLLKFGQTNWADKFWDIWGIFGRTISTYFGTVSLLSIFTKKNLGLEFSLRVSVVRDFGRVSYAFIKLNQISMVH